MSKFPLQQLLRILSSVRSFRVLGSGVVLLGGLCLSPACSRSDSVIVTGSSTVAPVMSEIGRAFEKKHPALRVQVQTGGSTRGVLDARSGLASIGMASRDAKANEKDLLFHRIAFDGITVIVHNSNPLENITRDRLRAVYRKEVLRWKDFQRTDVTDRSMGDIVVVHKAEGRSTLELFIDYLGVKNSALKPDIIIGDNEQGLKTVTGNVNAIAYVSIGAALYAVRSGLPVKLLALDGVLPTTENVRKAAFPISRSLNLITRKTFDAETKQLIDFARSSEAAPIIKNHYFIPAGQ